MSRPVRVTGLSPEYINLDVQAQKDRDEFLKANCKVGSVVQIDPAHDDLFGGLYLVVSEVKSWGVQGWVPEFDRTKRAYYRCPWAKLELVGQSAWLLADEVAQENDEEAI